MLSHVEAPGLGHLVRLYGGSIAFHRRTGGSGTETADGHEKLDLDHLLEAVHEGRAHRFWLLTTYTTLTNYQHSLGRIPFAAAVFDEIQALKNPQTLAAFAARAMKADFRIGLTGTPIENSTLDLWAIMDQLCPGALGTRSAYRERYGEPEEERLRELHGRLFAGTGGVPPIALRRLKEDAASHLPRKSRRLHPRMMPAPQAERYEDARRKLGNGGPGAALRMLHHIRGVSLHPRRDAAEEDFVSLSGRLSATFDLLREIRDREERALVFIEDRRMQHRFREFAIREFGLADIDIINGSTPIPRRQQIVERFQRQLKADAGFDVLILGPKAAGTGLTLTAATHVIHLSRWWNPAVEEQCNDRVHRIGQTRPVLVHVPMAVHPRYGEDSFDCHLHSLMQRKRRLARSAPWPMGDTSSDAAGLGESVGREALGAATTLEAAMSRLFQRDRVVARPPATDGSYHIE